MQSDFDLRTSATLLEQVRVLEDQQAWVTFMKLYEPLMWAWGKRAGLPDHDVQELIGRLQLKLVQRIPSFVYDPAKSFRGWLKTLVRHELADMARDANRRLPGERGTGNSEIYDLLLQHPDGLDELVDGLHVCSIHMLEVLHDAMEELRDACHDDHRISWEIFRRKVLMNEHIATLAKEFNLTVWAAGMRVSRMKESVRAKVTRLLGEHAQIELNGHGRSQN